MEFQNLDMLQNLYDKQELSREDYYALGYNKKISFEEMEQKYEHKSLRELRFSPTDSTK